MFQFLWPRNLGLANLGALLSVSHSCSQVIVKAGSHLEALQVENLLPRSAHMVGRFHFHVVIRQRAPASCFWLEVALNSKRPPSAPCHMGLSTWLLTSKLATESVSRANPLSDGVLYKEV